MIKDGKRHWSSEADKKLSSFLKRETNDLSDLLMMFSAREIIVRRDFLGFKPAVYTTPWEECDLELVREAFKDGEDNLDTTAMSKLNVLGRTKGRVFAKAEELGLKKPRTNKNCSDLPWSDEEVEILKRDYPIYGTHILELRAHGRTPGAIIAKADKLHLKIKH
jgi:hypothetical protein